MFEIINTAMVSGSKSWWQGFKIVFLTRASPLFPFPLINHAHGITQVPFSPYIAATALGQVSESLFII